MTQHQRVTAQAAPVEMGCDSAGNANGEPTPGCAGPLGEGTGYTPSRADEPLRRDLVMEAMWALRPTENIWPKRANLAALSPTYVLSSPVTLTADIAAGGAARQDDSEPKGQSSACRQQTSAIPTSTNRPAVIDGLMALARLGVTRKVQIRRDLFRVAERWMRAQSRVHDPEPVQELRFRDMSVIAKRKKH